MSRSFKGQVFLLFIILVLLLNLSRASPISCAEFAENIIVDTSLTFGNVTLSISGIIDSPHAFDYLCYCIAFPVNNRVIYLADITGLNVTNGNLTVEELPPASSMNCLRGLVSLNLKGQFLPDGPPSDWLSSMPELKALDLSFSHIERLHSSTIALVPSLKILNLQGNAIVLLPDDVFAQSKKLTTLYLDENFILDILPASIFTNASSLTLVSHFNTPRLSCLPPVSINSPFAPGSLPVCTVTPSFDRAKMLGGSIGCRQLRLSDANGWVTESDVNETIIDLSMMSRIDSSRFVNAAIIDQGATTAFIVDVLPAYRQGQVDAKSLFPLIKIQLLDSNSMLMSGIITRQLTPSSLIADVPVIRRYCKSNGLYLADAAICPTTTSSLVDSLPEHIYLWAIALGAVAGILIVSLYVQCSRKSVKSDVPNKAPVQQHVIVNSSFLIPVANSPYQTHSLHASIPVIYSNGNQIPPNETGLGQGLRRSG